MVEFGGSERWIPPCAPRPPAVAACRAPSRPTGSTELPAAVLDHQDLSVVARRAYLPASCSLKIKFGGSEPMDLPPSRRPPHFPGRRASHISLSKGNTACSLLSLLAFTHSLPHGQIEPNCMLSCAPRARPVPLTSSLLPCPLLCSVVATRLSSLRHAPKCSGWMTP